MVNIPAVNMVTGGWFMIVLPTLKLWEICDGTLIWQKIYGEEKTSTICEMWPGKIYGDVFNNLIGHHFSIELVLLSNIVVD